MTDKKDPVEVRAEVVSSSDPSRLAHLNANRGLIIRRALLSTALGGFIPLPVLDDVVAGRVRAGLYMKLAARRGVDLPASAADVLAEAAGGSTLRNITLTAATMLALKLAWRKFFALLAAGRGAEEMANTFQVGLLFDHYCTRLHVGGAISRPDANELRAAIHQTVSQMSRLRLAEAFRDGAQVLGRSVLEAPRWLSRQMASYAERWTRTGGNPNASTSGEPDQTDETEEERAWLDRAAGAVEAGLKGLGADYLVGLVDAFETRWAQRGSRDRA